MTDTTSQQSSDGDVKSAKHVGTNLGMTTTIAAMARSNNNEDSGKGTDVWHIAPCSATASETMHTTSIAQPEHWCSSEAIKRLENENMDGFQIGDVDGNNYSETKHPSKQVTTVQSEHAEAIKTDSLGNSFANGKSSIVRVPPVPSYYLMTNNYYCNGSNQSSNGYLFPEGNHWLEHLSMLSNGSKFESGLPYAQLTMQMEVTNLGVNTAVAAAPTANSCRNGYKHQTIETILKTNKRTSIFNKNSNSKQLHGPLSKEEQRKNACVRERTRMRDMNQAFDALRQRLPYIKKHGKRISKIEALRMTIKYIRQLRSILSETSFECN